MKSMILEMISVDMLLTIRIETGLTSSSNIIFQKKRSGFSVERTTFQVFFFSKTHFSITFI
jgi:hypothetical protein